jgi:galactofuranose transport system permease protein
MNDGDRRLGTTRLAWPLMALVLLLAFNAAYSENFLRLEIRDDHLSGTTIDILNQGSKVMLLAIGMTLVIATGGVDLSVGSVMAIAGAVAALLIAHTSLFFIWILALSLAAAALAGLWNGVLVSFLGIQPIVATLVLMVTGRGIAMLLTDGQIITVGHPALLFFGNGHLLGLPFTVWIVATVFVSTVFLTRRTALGLFLAAIGDNEPASRLAGLPSRALKTFAYCFSGVCAGLAGLIAMANIKAADSSRVGEMMELDAIFAVVVGGTGLTGGKFTLSGSLIGALLIQTLTTTMYNQGVSPSIAPVPKAMVILAVCLLQSPRFRQQIMSLLRREPT